MRVNRYTQYSPARYTPRTLQELMMVPMYKRQQHDALDAGIGELEANLAKADALPEHSEFLRQEQQKLYDEMTAQAEKLNSEGFSQGAKGDFIRFNKRFQQATGPQGTIGRIAKAKAAFELERNNYIANATKAGYSPTDAETNWNKHAADYFQGFDGTANSLKNIDALYAPNYYNVVDEVDKRAKQLGVNASDIGKISSKIVQTQDGSYVLEEGWEEALSSNLDAAQSLASWLTKQINNPNSSIGQSIAHQNMTPEQALGEIEGLTDVYTSQNYRRRDSERITSRQKNSSATQGADSSNVIFTHSSQTDGVGTDYSSTRDTINEVYSNENSTNDDIAQARLLDGVTSVVDEKLMSNPLFADAKNVLNDAYDSPEFKALDPKIQELAKANEDVFMRNGLYKTNTNYVNGEPQIEYTGVLKELQSGISNADMPSIEAFTKAWGEKLNGAADTIDGLRDGAISQEGFERTTIVVPHEKKADWSVQVLNALQAYGSDNIKPSSVLFYDAEGNNEKVELDEGAAEKAVNLFSNANEGDIKSIHPAKQGTKAGFVVTFKPQEGSKLNPSNSMGDQMKFGGIESLEMFIPVDALYDNVTNARATQSMFLEGLPPRVQRELTKYMMTDDIAPAITENNLGRANIPAERFFGNGKFENGTRLDLLKVPTKTEGSYASKVYSIDSKGNKRPMKWSEVLPENLDNEAVLANIANTLLLHSIVGVASQDPYQVEKYDLNNPENANIVQLLKDYRNKDVVLNSSSDLYSLGQFSRTTQMR